MRGGDGCNSLAAPGAAKQYRGLFRAAGGGRARAVPTVSLP